jgi:hypothetical protein
MTEETKLPGFLYEQLINGKIDERGSRLAARKGRSFISED